MPGHPLPPRDRASRALPILPRFLSERLIDPTLFIWRMLDCANIRNVVRTEFRTHFDQIVKSIVWPFGNNSKAPADTAKRDKMSRIHRRVTFHSQAL